MKPQYITDLEASYGGPSREGFGSAVFFKQVKSADHLEDVAREQYEYFVGEKWQAWGADTWLAPWGEAYRRLTDVDHDIAAELGAIDDFDTQMQVDMILNNIENPEEARKALSAAYDDAAVTDLRAYNIGDGEAMAGLLLAGRRDNGEATFLVFLMD